MRLTRTWLLLGAGALLVTSTKGAAQERMQGSGIRVTKERPAVSTTSSTTTVPSATVTTTTIVSTGEVTLTTPFDLAAYANLMNEGNIVAHMAAGDSLEIELGTLAQAKGSDQRVRDFGTTLVNDHTTHLANTIKMVTDEHIAPVPMATDPEGARLREILAQLRNMGGGTNWDAAFLRFQATHHQNEIDLLSANIKNAHDDDLEEHIQQSLKSLAKHRDLARSTATALP